MAIGVIFTGGTIGSKVGADGFITTMNEDINEDIDEASMNALIRANSKVSNYKLISMYYDTYDNDKDHKFVFSSPYTILSENLELQNVYKLRAAIYEMAATEYDDKVTGIIVTHGTDTLQYSAAFINYLCSHLHLPIVFVSSAYVLDDNKANGLVNFKMAVRFTEEYKKINASDNVFVSYKNTDGRCFIHRADKLLEHSAFSADLYSIKDEYFAEYFEDSDSFEIKYSSDECTVSSLSNMTETKKDLELQECVYRMSMYPGAIYPDEKYLDYLKNNGIKSILLSAYHSGTICINDRFKEFAKLANSKEIKLYLTGLDGSATFYETVKEYESLSINVLYDMAPISAYCRLTIEGTKFYDKKCNV